MVLASATDDDAMQAAAAGTDLVVHLASFPSERSWRDIVDVNIESARVALDAARGRRRGDPARELGARRGLRAVGRGRRWDAGGPAGHLLRRVSKVVAETLGDLYADRFGMRIVSARIMTFEDRPHTARARSTWLSPGDFARLVEAALFAPTGNHVVWGVSANSRRTVSLEPGRAIGYEPQDDAEAHVDALAVELGLDSPRPRSARSAPTRSAASSPSTPLGQVGP